VCAVRCRAGQLPFVDDERRVAGDERRVAGDERLYGVGDDRRLDGEQLVERLADRALSSNCRSWLWFEDG
jgi:hypothetical protein